MTIEDIASELDKITGQENEAILRNLSKAIRALSERTVQIVNTRQAWSYNELGVLTSEIEKALTDCGFGDIADQLKETAVTQFKTLDSSSDQINFGKVEASALSASVNAQMVGWDETVSKDITDFLRSRLASATVVPLKPEQLVTDMLDRYNNVTAAHASTYVSTALRNQTRDMFAIAGKSTGATHYKYIGPNDSRTRDICSARVGKVFTSKVAERMMGELRWNCRHSLVPVLTNEDTRSTTEDKKPEPVGLQIKDIKTVEQAKEYAAKIGIKNLTVNTPKIKVVKEALSVLESVQARFEMIPEDVAIDASKFVRRARHGIAAFDRSVGDNGAILINPKAKEWTSEAVRIAENEKSVASKWSSAKDKDFTIIHELGHQQHFLADRKLYGQSTMGNGFMFRVHRSTASQVSGYACYNAYEFVAETYAGLKLGKTYSEEVMKLYEMYGGPKV